VGGRSRRVPSAPAPLCVMAEGEDCCSHPVTLELHSHGLGPIGWVVPWRGCLGGAGLLAPGAPQLLPVGWGLCRWRLKSWRGAWSAVAVTWAGSDHSCGGWVQRQHASLAHIKRWVACFPARD
jgi:hypothetical protein